MTTGEPLVVRGSMKPLPTLTKPLRSVDIATHEPAEALRERTDSCTVPAAGVVGEAMVAFVLADAYRRKFGGDHIDDVTRRRAPPTRSGSAWRRPQLSRTATGQRRVVCIGFMGAGKSTAAAAPPRRSARARSTSTSVIEAAARQADRARSSPRTARRRSARRGASHARAAGRRRHGRVLALGGGAIGSRARPRGARASICVVWLDVDLDDGLGARAEGSGRPLARDRAAVRAAVPPSASRSTRSSPT